MALRLSLLLWTVLLILPSLAWAEVCTVNTGAQNWTSITDDIASDCTEGADDSFVIPSGATLTVTNGSTVTQTGAGLDITVQSGGALLVNQGGRLQAADDIIVQSGGSFTVAGKAMDWSDNGFTETALDGSTTAIPLGELIHCAGVGDSASGTGAAPVEDCGEADPNYPGNASWTYFCWPDAIFDQADGETGDRNFPGVTGAVDLGDQVVFYDPTNLNPSRDINAHYEIVDVNYGDDPNDTSRCIGVDVAGEFHDDPNNLLPIGDRDIKKITLESAQLAGDRTLTLLDPTVGNTTITRVNQYAARYLTCDRPDGVMPGPTAMIWDTVDSDDPNTADTITLWPGGFAQDIAAGTECFIDMGHQPGDILGIYEAAIVGGNSASDELDCQLGSTCTITFAAFDGIGSVEINGTGHTLNNSDLRVDDDGGGGLSLDLKDVGAMQIQRVQVMGGDHGYTAQDTTPGGNDGLVVSDAVVKYASDDSFILHAEDTDEAFNGGCWNRLRIAFADGTNGSASPFDVAAPSGFGPEKNWCVDGFFIQYGLGPDQTTGVLFTDPASIESGKTPGRRTYKNGAAFGNHGSITNDPRSYFRNLYVGWQDAYVNVGLLGSAAETRNATFRDFRNTGASTQWLWERNVQAPTLVSKTLVYDYLGTRGAINVADDPNQLLNKGAVIFEDVAFVSPETSVGTAVIDINAHANETQLVSITRATVAWFPGEETTFVSGVDINGDDTALANLRVQDGILIAYGKEVSSQTFLGVDGTAADAGNLTNLCLSGNDQDGDTGFDAQFPASTLRDAPFRFEDAQAGRFQLVRGSRGYDTCGAINPGVIPESNWGLKASGYDAYKNGDTWRPRPGARSVHRPTAR